jgi:DNA invertase Pin-like site-specific DNA recombinase
MLVDGYVRVSQVAGRGGETFISPAVQRGQIESWAELAGATIGRVFEELDESGARADRPKLMEALARAERGESQGSSSRSSTASVAR